MENYTLNRADIEEVDIETTGVCNLFCPLCLSRLPEFKKFFTPHNLELDKIKSVLDSFVNLDQATIAGDASEPTLYPYLFELLDYLATRPKVYVEVFTNGSTHNNEPEYWQELARRMPANSFLVFTICGTNQQLHEKYRVGSKLDDILRNVEIYKKARTLKPNDCMQYIRFEYNKNDNEEKLKKLESMFTQSYRCNTNPIYERVHAFKKCPDDVCLEKTLQRKYMLSIINNRKQKPQMSCHMFNIRQLRIDNFGNIYPCSFYKFFHKNPSQFIKDDNTFDYTDIYENKCDFCYECTQYMAKFFEETNCKQSFMC